MGFSYSMERMKIEMPAPFPSSRLDREAAGLERAEWLKQAKIMSALFLSRRSLVDLEAIGIGSFKPLKGFMGKQDYLMVLKEKRLCNGLKWNFPVTLPVEREQAERYLVGDYLALKGMHGIVYGVLLLTEKFSYDKFFEAKSVCKASDMDQSDMKRLFDKGDVYFAGPILMLNRPSEVYNDDNR